MFRHDASRTGASTLPGPSSPGLSWSYNPLSSLPYINGVFSTAAVSDEGNIYVGGLDNNLYCLTSRGALNWTYATEFLIVNSPALGADGGVIFGSSLNLYSLASGGSLKWSYACGSTGPIESSPVLGTNGAIYIGSPDNRLYSFSPSGSLLWSYRSGYHVLSSPALGSDGRVYCGSEDNTVYTLLSDGSLLWSYETGDYLSSTPTLAGDGRAFISGGDNMLYAFAPGGSLSWSYEVDADAPIIDSSPALTGGGRLYVSSSERHLCCLASNGSLSWSLMTGMPMISSPVVGQDDVGYVSGLDGTLRAFDSAGTVLWTYQTGVFPGFGMNVALTDDRRILLSSLAYFGGGTGALHCIGERPPSLDVIPSSNSPAVGDPFTVQVTVKPIGGAFDAWGIVQAPGGRTYSFNLRNPSTLRQGMQPLALNVPGLDSPYAGTLLSLSAIPGGAAGTYQIYVGLVPAGRAPTLANAIPDYLDHETIVIH
jgi:outer membrane protein assembly factor BamB